MLHYDSQLNVSHGILTPDGYEPRLHRCCENFSSGASASRPWNYGPTFVSGPRRISNAPDKRRPAKR